MIIIEGPDNSGKSTLATYLGYELNIEVYHGGGPPASEEQLLQRINFCLDNHDKYIFDRIPLISEPVYSILRPQGNMLANHEDLYYHFRKLKPIIIYCRPQTGLLLNWEKHNVKAYDSKDHVEKVIEKAEQLVNRYDEVMNSEFLPSHLTYNYEEDGYDKIVEDVRNEIARLGHYKGKELRPSIAAEQAASSR